MRFTLLNASPKKKNSASALFLDYLEEQLKDNQIFRHQIATLSFNELLSDIKKSEAFVVAFPLYVDGIPSHLLRLLEQLEVNLKDNTTNTAVYVIVNCGFFEAEQAAVAIKQLQLWCKKSNLKWGAALSIGGGGMAGAAPIGHGPVKSWGLALTSLANTILIQASKETSYVRPNFPRFLYIKIAHFSWRAQAKKYGIKPKAMHKRRKLEEV